MVIATQNPIEQAGTYRLPEAQLDRFLIKTSVGYPDAESTEELLLNSRIRDRAALIRPVVSKDDVARMIGMADEVYVDRSIVRYVRELAEASRVLPHVKMGLSARGCLAFVRAAKTWAAADGRGHVVPHDIATLAEPVLVPPDPARRRRRSSAGSRSPMWSTLLADVPPRWTGHG